MKNWETVRLLFEVHHRQMEERRTKIHNITERTMALLIAIAGWLIVSDNPPSGEMRWVLVIGILVITGTACAILHSNNRSYLQIASVIQKLNQALGTFEAGHFVAEEPLYPAAWKSFGLRRPFRTIWHHWTFIIVLAMVCIAAAFSR